MFNPQPEIEIFATILLVEGKDVSWYQRLTQKKGQGRNIRVREHQGTWFKSTSGSFQTSHSPIESIASVAMDLRRVACPSSKAWEKKRKLPKPLTCSRSSAEMAAKRLKQIRIFGDPVGPSVSMVLRRVLGLCLFGTVQMKETRVRLQLGLGPLV